MWWFLTNLDFWQWLWVVVPGWQLLWVVPLIGVWDVHGGNWWLLGVIGFGAWWLLVVYCNGCLYYFIVMFILFYCV